MHLIIDGYNLLHVHRTLTRLNAIQLQWERDRLVEELSAYQKIKSSEITVVFDGWQGGWVTEKKEMKKGIELIYSKLGEKADEVIKRLLKREGSGAIVITSDREVSRFAERMAIPVIPSDQFKEKIERAGINMDEVADQEEEEVSGSKRKGQARRLSKKGKRAKAALKKL
jgi:predicted RNA-binding protein with PIN domain